MTPRKDKPVKAWGVFYEDALQESDAWEQHKWIFGSRDAARRWIKNGCYEDLVTRPVLITVQPTKRGGKK